MVDDRVTLIAETLAAAARRREPVPPPSEVWPGLTLDDAYAAQLAGVRMRLAEGASVVGHKVGLTSAAMQQMLGIDQPDYGHLLSDMAVADTVPASRFCAPRAEVEIAFLLGHPLRGPGVTAADVRAATERVVPAIEIIDSRVADWRIGLVDTVADNASSGAFALGNSSGHPDRLDLPAARCQLVHNGRLAFEGSGADVLGDPAAAVAWLANLLGERDVALEPGDVLLSGACTRAVPVSAGDTVAGVVDGLGTVSVTFT